MIFVKFADKKAVLLYPVLKICVKHSIQMSMVLRSSLWTFVKKLFIHFATTIKKVQVGGIELRQSLF